MHVCICRQITSGQLRKYFESIKERPTTAEAAHLACSFNGESFQCGMCKPDIEEMVESHNAALSR